MDIELIEISSNRLNSSQITSKKRVREEERNSIIYYPGVVIGWKSFAALESGETTSGK